MNKYLFWNKLNRKSLKVYLRYQKYVLFKTNGLWLRGIGLKDNQVYFIFE